MKIIAEAPDLILKEEGAVSTMKGSRKEVEISASIENLLQMSVTDNNFRPNTRHQKFQQSCQNDSRNPYTLLILSNSSFRCRVRTQSNGPIQDAGNSMQILATHAVCRQSGVLEVGCSRNCSETGSNSAVRGEVAVIQMEWLRQSDNQWLSINSKAKL